MVPVREMPINDDTAIPISDILSWNLGNIVETNRLNRRLAELEQVFQDAVVTGIEVNYCQRHWGFLEKLFDLGLVSQTTH